MSLGALPWSEGEIRRILPHREPFLLVDRIVELDPDLRVVGLKTWAQHDCQMALPDGSWAVPAPYLIECMAQVGAALILSRPENQGRVIYFLGIERGRLRAPVRAGDTLRVEARVRRLRSRMGTLSGRATIDGRDGLTVADGVMTFALGETAGGPA